MWPVLLLLACVVPDAPAPVATPPPAVPPAPEPAPTPDLPSILVVTLDTTRADRMGAYGRWPQAETPTFDALAEAGTLFTRASASCPLTIPSHSTIFTGRLPPSHGVRDNGDFVLPPSAVTLAERFRDAGWSTAAWTSAFPTHSRWGLSQGFELYRDPLPRSADARDWRDQRTADEVVDQALDDLETLDGPLFAWVHLFDAHWPYDPPEPFRSRHEGRPYDGEIAFADHQLGRFIEAFRARWPRHVIAVTADHGEGLGDGGEQTHGFLLHDGTIHVPLVLAGEGVPAGEVVRDPVGHADLAPTLLRLAGIDPHEGLQGHDLFDGGSELVYSEALTGQFQLGLAALSATTGPGGRFTTGSFGAFYAVDAATDTVATTPDDVELDPHRTAHDALVATLEPDEGARVTLGVDDMELLVALGYAGGDPSTEAGDLDPRDVIGLIPLTWQARQLLGEGRIGPARAVFDRLRTGMPDAMGVDLLEAQLLRAEGDLDAALSALVRIWQQAPSSTTARQIADLYLRMGDPTEARTWYAHALELLANDPGAMTGLVRSALAQGDEPQAREWAEAFLRVHPDHTELHLVLAELLLVDRQLDLALAEAQRGLDQLPWDPWPHALWARIAWELGRPDAAIDRLGSALDLSPLDVGLRSLRTRWLLEVGRHAEAVRTIRPMHALLPDDDNVRTLHDEAMAALGRERGGR